MRIEGGVATVDDTIRCASGGMSTRWGSGGAAQLLADPSRMASQSLWALFDLDRPEVLQKARGDALRHQSRNMCSQLV